MKNYFLHLIPIDDELESRGRFRISEWGSPNFAFKRFHNF
jgi:hypothetical protein